MIVESPNVQLQALTKSLVSYAISQGWLVEDVDAAFKSAMKPMRKLEAQSRVRRQAQELTQPEAEDVLIRAMGEYWDSDVMTPFFEALKLRFPKRIKSIAKIDDWAGDASNERSDNGDLSDFEKLASKALDALERLPWGTTFANKGEL